MNFFWVGKVGVRIEFKWQDMWVGVFYHKYVNKPGAFIERDWWVCIIPCFPIHITYEKHLPY